MLKIVRKNDANAWLNADYSQPAWIDVLWARRRSRTGF